MRTRLLALAMIVLVLGAVCGAQDKAAAPSVDSYIESLRADARADKIAIITDAMQFNDKDAKMFWPVYRKYEAELVKLNDQRVSIIKMYAAKFDTMSDADARTLINQSVEYSVERANLQKKYAKEFEKSGLPILTVAKYLQLEHRLNLIVDVAITAQLPPLLLKP